MNRPRIITHCLVRNEERFIWYSLNSVLPYVDKVMVWDTGSTDKTVAVIKSIKTDKIEFKQVGSVDPDSFTAARQQMLEQTPKSFSWLMILDGDEIWPESSIKKVSQFAKEHSVMESIAVRTHNLVGDIYHRLPESAGRYHLAGRTGHLSLRLMNLHIIPGLHVDKPHGQQGYFDIKNKLVQDRSPKKIKFIDVYYHHATHLIRSSSRQLDLDVPKRSFKLKYEIGEKIPPRDIPEIFYKTHPQYVPDVTSRAPLSFWLKSLVLTAPRRLKRLVSPVRHGY